MSQPSALAVTRGVYPGGYAALARLQAQIAGADEGIRARATEIIDAIAASDEAEDTSVHRKAVGPMCWRLERLISELRPLRHSALCSHIPTQPLIARLRDREPEVRIAAARALGKLGAQEALEPLRAALRHGSPELRIAIVEALGAYQPRRPPQIWRGCWMILRPTSAPPLRRRSARYLTRRRSAP